MNGTERRYASHDGHSTQHRAGGNLPRIVGYAAVFYRSNDPGTQYELADNFVERIATGAFSRTIRDDDVRALFNHDADNLLGRTRAGTLRLSLDARGLRYEIDLPDTSIGRQIAKLVKRGDVTGSSFGFAIRDFDLRYEGSLLVRELTEVQLFDVGPVTFPAYTATTAGVRAALSAEARRDADLCAVALALMDYELTQ